MTSLAYPVIPQSDTGALPKYQFALEPTLAGYVFRVKCGFRGDQTSFMATLQSIGVAHKQ